MVVHYYGLLDCAKAGLDQFRMRLKYEPESLEPLINGDLGVATTKTDETLHGDSSFGSLGLHESWARSVSYPSRI